MSVQMGPTGGERAGEVPVLVAPAEVQAAPQPIRRLPKRIVTVALPEPYDEFHVTIWVNHPVSLETELQSGDQERIRAALLQVYLGHDLVDFDGNPYPPMSDPAFWDVCPPELGAVFYQVKQEQIGKLGPKSPRR